MAAYAIVEQSGKQFLVEEGCFYTFNRLPLEEGETFFFERVLFVKHKDKMFIGQPFLRNSFFIKAKVLNHFFGQKTTVFKMKPKKKTRKTSGSKEYLTRVLITNILELAPDLKNNTSKSCSIS